MKNILRIIVVTTCLCWFSCKTDKTPLGSNLNADKIYTARDSLEATEFALWLSGDLFAPDSLVENLLYKLQSLRNTYGDSIAVLDTSNRFMLPWVRNQLLVKFDDTTYIEVITNNYSGWNELPDKIQPDTILDTLGFFNHVLFGYDTNINPRRLAEIYSDLPGVIYASSNEIGTAGIPCAGFPWYPGWLDNSLAILFWKCSWDEIIYYYFKIVDDHPMHIGTFNTSIDTMPYWWSEAWELNVNFETWDGF